ncbi:hypothetical protein CAMGR0001_0803 [Campylobacter gracilis RM3268]|uniref:Uncharacterized protein n=1 Tax=Campylobacter gracilis RM3268 TaxID=553220 RepID=C8PG10_9BACT|nr:hypothetical protein CAMGR0001_0803 [Campylobacter gracilis RM3268]
MTQKGRLNPKNLLFPIMHYQAGSRLINVSSKLNMAFKI